MSDDVNLSLEDVRAIVLDIFSTRGVSAAQTNALADVITAAERDNCKSHGLFRVPGYVASVESGKMNKTADPKVRQLAPSVLQVDAQEGFAPLALHVGHKPLAELARAQGIAALGILNSLHFQAVWYEVEALAQEGLVALACVTASSSVAPAGGIKPLFGTNPMAFGWPRRDGPPLVFDQAASASARGEIQIHKRDGKPIPQGWAIDADGNPTTDPTAALAGAQLPFGGYKGSSIALMIELLAGAMIGDIFSYEVSERDSKDGGPMSRGETIIAIDPARCLTGGNRDAQLAHAEGLFERILAQDGTRLPSDRRYAARLQTPTSGVFVPRSLHDTLESLRNSGGQ
ncbi:MAG: delta1-piperideine-2-carboxylate reductase [Gammaproteobacteria bacterium]|jgi:delta1-piperideine-2-carboxylate reductase